MVDSLFFCATITGHRNGHTPSIQAGMETSDTGPEAVKPAPCCSWKGYSERVGVSVRDKSRNKRSHNTHCGYQCC